MVSDSGPRRLASHYSLKASYSYTLPERGSVSNASRDQAQCQGGHQYLRSPDTKPPRHLNSRLLQCRSSYLGLSARTSDLTDWLAGYIYRSINSSRYSLHTGFDEIGWFSFTTHPASSIKLPVSTVNNAVTPLPHQKPSRVSRMQS